ncbi:MAG: type VI secretion system tip protein TssI/VgrG, partial [Solirubrobacteraceae bacterium]|nr:type VI secretion system tip protein TssI/VgrG [Solirubrobacteraceae bacterium]
AQLGTDGGIARYRLTMRPWLSFLAHRTDSFVYQDKTAAHIIEEVFKDHPSANFTLQISQPLRMRSLCTQYRETDLAFVQRLLAEEGLTYHFEHLDAEAAKGADNMGHARHLLVVTDSAAERPTLGDVRFARQHVTANMAGQKDAITAFSVARQIAANSVALGAWDYERIAGIAATDRSALDLGKLPALEVYDGAGAYRYENPAHAERAARLALAALELGYKRLEGQGSARHFAVGRRFRLIDHPLFGANTTSNSYAGAASASHARPDNEFTLVEIEHRAANNLGAQAAELLKSSELEQGTYLNHFHCVPAVAPLVPPLVRKPTAPLNQTALVVGIGNEPLTTDRDHRVKVQFAWQRGLRPNAGGLAHASSADSRGNAPGNEQSGTWVRLAEPAAGANWGSVYTPRVGTEVAIGFIEGDID